MRHDKEGKDQTALLLYVKSRDKQIEPRGRWWDGGGGSQEPSPSVAEVGDIPKVLRALMASEFVEFIGTKSTI
jgi:hypothetical protein